MVELENKYQIGKRRFGINWVGAYTLYLKETLRFLSVLGQTIIGPVVTAILFLLVISLAIDPYTNGCTNKFTITLLAALVVKVQALVIRVGLPEVITVVLL